MALLVQKYGGSSVADVECMRRVAKRIYDSQQAGNDVVVIVSAMGDTTDNLINLANELNADSNDREMDMLMSCGEQISSSLLAMTLHSLGAEAVAMTGPQAGIRTDGFHTRAKILDVKPERMQESLNAGQIVIVAGFQGLNPQSDIATLGRGGSDTTAVAVAAALEADRCQIYTDVDGVYTADPRLVKGSQKIDEISYDEMLELASLGANVLQSRSVEFAKKFGVELEVLSSFRDSPGTVVKDEVDTMEDIVVRGVAVDKGEVKVTISKVVDQPGVASEVFSLLASKNISVDMIVQNVSKQGHTDISFTIADEDLARTKKAVEEITADMDNEGVIYNEKIAKVSLVGVGMRSHCGVASKMFSGLAKKNVNIEMISTSEIKISVVIKREQADDAAKILHKIFELDQE